MKHTFKLIDNLLILLNNIPRDISTEEGKKQAYEVLEKIRKYTISLERLTDAHKEEEHLRRLHQEHEAEKVEELFGKLHQLLSNVKDDADKLEAVIKNSPDRWLSMIGDLALGMVMTGLHDEEEELKRFKQHVLFEEEKLKQILNDEEHLAEILC